MRRLFIVIIGASALVLLIAIAILAGQANSGGYIGTLDWPAQVNQSDVVGIHDLEAQVNVTRANDP